MKRWRWIVILLIALSLAVLIAESLLEWQVWAPHPSFVREHLPARYALAARPASLVSTTAALLTLYFSGILLMFAFPRRIGHMTRLFVNKPLRLLRLTLVGFLTALLVMVISVGSAISMGTFPLTILLFVVLFSGSLVGLVALAYTLGRELLRRAGWPLSPIYALMLGQLILFAFERLPWIGGLFLVLFASLGLGATIVSHFGSGEPWNLPPLLEANQE